MQNAAKVSPSARRSSCYHIMPMKGHMLHCLGSHCICRCSWPSMDVFLENLFPQLEMLKKRSVHLAIFLKETEVFNNYHAIIALLSVFSPKILFHIEHSIQEKHSPCNGTVRDKHSEEVLIAKPST